MKSKLILQPGDYIVLHPGLRIENTSGDMTIECAMPSVIAVSKVKHEFKEVKLDQ